MKLSTPFLVNALSIQLVRGWAVPRLYQRQDDLSTQTTFQGFDGCSADQKTIIEQAHTDALTLAQSAVTDRHDELIVNGDNYGPLATTINFNTQAALDYFGPSSYTAPYQAYILDTFVRAIASYRGIGLSDWWYNRYVNVRCTDPNNVCGTDSAAYTTNGNSLPFPTITYCPAFFDKLPAHSDLVNAIKADKTNKMKLNIRNLRSRATTALHEWLHIKGTSAEVCVGGCVDHRMTVGPDKPLAYKAGRTKLLAQQNTAEAVRNNDNYAYFAMANFMLKTFGTYPTYPVAWDASKSVADNQKVEDEQPGAPATAAADEIDDSASPDATTSTDSGSAPPPSSYPDWYQPILTADGANSAPSVTVPPAADPNADATYPLADITTIKCDTDSNSPLIDDCVHAFGALIQSYQGPALKGKNGASWWAGYVESCALNVKFGADWGDSCGATLDDIWGYAQSVFLTCQDGGLGKVAGSVPFNVANCPAEIEIIPTAGQQPPNGGL